MNKKAESGSVVGLIVGFIVALILLVGVLIPVTTTVVGNWTAEHPEATPWQLTIANSLTMLILIGALIILLGIFIKVFQGVKLYKKHKRE